MGSRFLKMGAGLIFVLWGQQVAALPPAWTDDNYGQGATPQNRRGPNPSYARAPFKPQAALPFGKLEDDGGSGSGNYSFSLPLLAFPGRGLPLRLDLLFSSQVWSVLGNGDMLFDADADWPSPGWSLGFGRLVTTTDETVPGSHQVLQGLLLSGNHGRQSLKGFHEAGNHRHLRVPGESRATIEICCYDPEYVDVGTSAVKSDGAGGSITYTNFEPGNKSSVYYPVQLTDANGNFISINYVVKAGKPQPPRIDTIVDTVGRKVRFYYDAAEHLVTISGFGPDSEETVYARFVYWPAIAVDVKAGAACKPVHAEFDQLSGVIFPATSHAFWLPYPSVYGTATWFWQSTSAKFQDTSPFDQQMTVTSQGRETSKSVFDYSSPSANGCITQPPGYTTRTDTWRDDIDGVPKTATTTYVRAVGDEVITTVTNADSSGSRQFVPTYDDESMGVLAGQVRRVENLDSTGNLLSSTDFEWSLVSRAPRQEAIVQNIDPLGRGKRTTFEYDPTYPYVLTTTRFYGYSNGQTAAPLEHSVSTTFVRDADVVAAGFLTLPQTVVHTAAQSNEQTVRTFEYDTKPLTAVGMTTTHHGHDYEPHSKLVCVERDPPTGPGGVCVKWKSVPQRIVTVRGNLTKLTDFADAANRASPISKNFEYDSTGNVLRTFDDLGSGTAITFGAEYQFSLPTMVVSGSVDPASPLKTTSTVDYYFGTGLTKSVRDADGLLTSYEYGQGDSGWRISLVKSEDKGTTGWAYDDDALTTTTQVYDATNVIADGVVVQNDGWGRVRRLTGNRGGPFKVDTEYDAVGRVVRRSNPYWQDVPIWTTWTFDGLGRPTTLQTPGNPVATYFAYDMLPIPKIAPVSPPGGNTLYITDPWGRKRWLQNDSSGNLKYAVETVAPLSLDPPLLNVLTQYEHDVFGRLRTITAGVQTRLFSYDDLGRLVGQALPERQATLDVTGAYGGQSGTLRYSDVYQYDARSNLVTSIDARGVRTRFDYANDPLNRLHGINYDVPNSHDNSSPIQPVAPITFTYKAPGSPNRIERIDSGNLAVVFDYDSQWRLWTQTSTYASHPQQPFEFRLSYDSFGRPASLTYPARYDAAGSAGLRRTVGTSYERNMPSQVTIEGLAIISPVVYGSGGVFRSMTTAFPSGPVTESFELDKTTGMPSAHKAINASGKLLYGLTFNYRRSDTSPNNGISGQLASVRNLVKPALSQNYYYDPAGRLGQSVTGDMGATSYDVNALYQSYSYDRYGNRSAVEAFRVAANPCGVSGTPACNFTMAGDLERDGAATLAYDEKTNRMTGPNFSYDASGNLIRATFMRRGEMQSNAIIYDAAGRIANVSDSNGKVLEAYEYGADRRRVRAVYYPGIPLRNPREVYSNWLGNSVLSESTANLVVGPAEPIRWRKDNIQAFGQRRFSETSAGRSFYINDKGGTAAELTPGSGTDELKHRASRPFGTEPEVPAGGDDDERFTTYKRSQPTGLDYSVNRFYSAELGRFLQVDPMGGAPLATPGSQSLNAYLYTSNDPINSSDPLGLFRIPAGCTQTRDANGRLKFDSPGIPAVTCGGGDVTTVVGQPIEKPFDFGSGFPTLGNEFGANDAFIWIAQGNQVGSHYIGRTGTGQKGFAKTETERIVCFGANSEGVYSAQIVAAGVQAGVHPRGSKMGISGAVFGGAETVYMSPWNSSDVVFHSPAPIALAEGSVGIVTVGSFSVGEIGGSTEIGLYGGVSMGHVSAGVGFSLATIGNFLLFLGKSNIALGGDPGGVDICH